MPDELHDGIDVEKLFAAMAPPRIPDEAFSRENRDLTRITTWKRSFVVSVLAGLLTEPRYHANGIRLDWLQRLVFSKSNGPKKPGSEEISRALNAGPDRAKVLRLEDPSEDLFSELIMTPQGNFRIFAGPWENAGPYTQTLLDAFAALPDGSAKQNVLSSAYAALRLSDELAKRAGVVPLSETNGIPQGKMGVPSIDKLRRLARRVTFRDADLARLGIDKAALSPFVIERRQFPNMSDRAPGDTPLEFHPLLETSSGIVVASPAAISLAVRAVCVNAAQNHGMEKALLYSLLRRQQRYSETSGFWPVRTLELPAPDQYFLRVAACQYAEGHFLQVIQVPVTFSAFPTSAFGSVVALDTNAAKAVAGYVRQFRRFLGQQANYRSGTTVVLTSGWGTPHSITPPINYEDEPQGWQFLYLNFADAAVLGACEDGNFTDIVRVLRQVDLLHAEGFEFQNPNGTLNLFGFWRATRGNLIPEHFFELEPPCFVAMPTDELLKPRIEAVTKVDRRALPVPGGGYKTVQRIEWNEDNLKPIYGSIDDIIAGRLLGAVAIENHVWWIESIPDPGENRKWRYRIWQAVLEWLAAVGPQIVSTFKTAYPSGTSPISLFIPPDSAFEQIDPDAAPTLMLSQTITNSAPDGNRSRIVISADWLAFLRGPENDGEIELVAAILESFADPLHPVPRANLAEQILHSIGSRDWRWMHVRRAFIPADRLAHLGLVDSFRKVQLSAVSLVKCGSIWGFRARAEGMEVNGEEECQNFLGKYRNHILDQLIGEVKKFDRVKLVTLAAGSYQAARVEQQRWRGTIRAMRAIHGGTADGDAFKRQNEINAVQRAAKSICEIAACEAPQNGGLNPDPLELDELFARALLLFGNGQLFAAIRAGLIEPRLRISPAGDLLSERSVFEVTLRPGAEWIHSQALDKAASAYGRDPTQHLDAAADSKLSWDEGLRDSLEAEYGDSPEALFDLQYALIDAAAARGQGAFVIRRSDVCTLLTENELFPSGNHAPMLERLTLPRRASWRDRSLGLTESDIDVSRFDRRFSLINRPLLALDDDSDPILLVAPIFVADASMYSVSGLMEGTLNNQFWVSAQARQYAGSRGKAAGEAFEESVAERLRGLKMEAWVRCKLSWALNQKVPNELGDVDILAVSSDRKRVWAIEAKNLRLCRTGAEVAARLSEYRGRMISDNRGRQEPDKMLRHILRVQYLREQKDALCKRLKLDEPPVVRGLLIVDTPQPMNFHVLERLEDGNSAFLEAIDSFDF